MTIEITNTNIKLGVARSVGYIERCEYLSVVEKAIFEGACVGLSIWTLKTASSVILSLKPFTFINRSIDSYKFSSSIFRTVPPLALIKRAVRPYEGTDTVIFSILPLSVVLGIHLCHVGASTMILSLTPVTFIETAVGKSQSALAM